MLADILVSIDKEGGSVGQQVLGAKTKMTEVTNKLECLPIQTHHGVPITFTEEDMLIGDVKHNRPLYFTEHIREVEVLRIQIDLGSFINIMPTWVMIMIGIPNSALRETNVSI